MIEQKLRQMASSIRTIAYGLKERETIGISKMNWRVQFKYLDHYTVKYEHLIRGSLIRIFNDEEQCIVEYVDQSVQYQGHLGTHDYEFVEEEAKKLIDHYKDYQPSTDRLERCKRRLLKVLKSYGSEIIFSECVIIREIKTGRSIKL